MFVQKFSARAPPIAARMTSIEVKGGTARGISRSMAFKGLVIEMIPYASHIRKTPAHAVSAHCLAPTKAYLQIPTGSLDGRNSEANSAGCPSCPIDRRTRLPLKSEIWTSLPMQHWAGVIRALQVGND